MDSLRLPRFLILFCAVSWVVVQQSMQRTCPHTLSTDVQHVWSSSTPADVVDMGHGQKSERADTVDHLRTQVDEPKEEQRKRRVKRLGGRSRRSERGNRTGHTQECRKRGSRPFCEFDGNCGWKNLNFEKLVMEERGGWAMQLENGTERGFLKSELACSTGGETHCFIFDYKMDKRYMDELLVSLDDQKTTTPVRLWRTRAADEPSGWNTAYIAIRSSTSFQVEIRGIRCDPEQKFLSPVLLCNIQYQRKLCATTPAVEPPYDSPCEASSSGSRHTSAVTSPVSSTSDSTVISIQNTPVTPSVLTTSGMLTGMTSVQDAGRSVDDEDDDDDDDDDKKGVVIAVVVSCALVVMALLAMAIVCWRRRSRKRMTSTPSTVMPSGAQSQDDHPAGRQNQAAPPRPTAAQDSSPADEDYSHLNSHRPRPTPPEHTGFTSEDTYNHVTAATRARSPAAAHPQNSGNTSEDTYNHVTAATRARSPAAAHPQNSGNTSEDIYNHLAAAPSASSPALGQSEDNTYTEANEVRAPDLTAATSRRFGPKEDYNHLNLGGRGARVEAGRVEEGGEESKLYDGLRAEKGDVYDRVRRGRKEEVIDETYSHI